MSRVHSFRAVSAPLVSGSVGSINPTGYKRVIALPAEAPSSSCCRSSPCCLFRCSLAAPCCCRHEHNTPRVCERASSGVAVAGPRLYALTRCRCCASICRYFAAGNCFNGDQCNFLHHSPAAAAAQASVPQQSLHPATAAQLQSASAPALTSTGAPLSGAMSAAAAAAIGTCTTRRVAAARLPDTTTTIIVSPWCSLRSQESAPLSQCCPARLLQVCRQRLRVLA